MVGTIAPVYQIHVVHRLQLDYASNNREVMGVMPTLG